LSQHVVQPAAHRRHHQYQGLQRKRLGQIPLNPYVYISVIVIICPCGILRRIDLTSESRPCPCCVLSFSTYTLVTITLSLDHVLSWFCLAFIHATRSMDLPSYPPSSTTDSGRGLIGLRAKRCHGTPVHPSRPCHLLQRDSIACRSARPPRDTCQRGSDMAQHLRHHAVERAHGCWSLSACSIASVGDKITSHLSFHSFINPV